MFCVWVRAMYSLTTYLNLCPADKQGRSSRSPDSVARWRSVPVRRRGGGAGSVYSRHAAEFVVSSERPVDYGRWQRDGNVRHRRSEWKGTFCSGMCVFANSPIFHKVTNLKLFHPSSYQQLCYYNYHAIIRML